MENRNQTKAKILVIDDEGDLSELVKIALRQDYIVEVVFDGREALLKLDDFRPDLIITDIYLPLIGGVDLLDEIRKVSATPIIIVSDGRLRRKMSYFQSKGISAVIMKPFSLKELKAEIQSALASYAKFI